MKVSQHVEKLLRQGRNPKELVEMGFPKSVVTRVRRQLRKKKAVSKRIVPERTAEAESHLQCPAELPENIAVILSQRLEKVEKALYQLMATYAFNEVAKEKEQGARKAPPCPECLKRGDRGFVWGIKRRMTPKDRREFIESIEDAEELSEEERQELSEPEPTHAIETKCHECGYTQFIGYAWE